jgi:hypothetical protein
MPRRIVDVFGRLSAKNVKTGGDAGDADLRRNSVQPEQRFRQHPRCAGHPGYDYHNAVARTSDPAGSAGCLLRRPFAPVARFTVSPRAR